MVKVCDALCGFGKTSACIKMMNENTDKKYIFVTQFLSEVDRIKTNCASRGFVAPDSNVKLGQTKLSDIHRLMREGKNIATTHSLFVSYTDETKELIQQNNYTLVLDESVDVMCLTDMARGDLSILKSSSAVTEEDGMIKWIMDDYQCEYDRGKFREEMLRAKSKNLLMYADEFFFWSIPPALFTCFSDVYVLTYMFSAQSLRCFFDIHHIPYELIGVRKSNGGYNFCAVEEMDRSLDLRDKIHILDDKKINSIGDARTALSFSWYNAARLEEGKPKIERLRKNIANVFKNIYKASAKEVLWTMYKEYVPMVRGNGYHNGFIPYNLRASNQYANRKYLAYCVNNFPRPMEKRYFLDHGTTWDGDMYALSILIQWVFRSAIRRGEEVWLYIPSKRMRSLFKQWLENLAAGRDLEPVSYKTPRKSRAIPGAKRGRPVGSTKNRNKENENNESK